MKKIVILIFIFTCTFKVYALESIVGKVIFVEPTYMPNQVVFKMDTGNLTCPKGQYLKWNKNNIENNKAILMTVTTALATGQRVRFYFNDGDSNCLGRYIHLLAD